MKNQLNRLSILFIADSEEDVRRIMGELAGADREIDGGCVENPEKLDAALREKGWDIALFDASMAGLDVQAALQKVRNADRKLPFIVETKPVGEAQTADWMRAGVSDVVVRGDSERLVEAVKREAQSAGTDHGDNALPDRFERTVKEAPFPIMVHAEDGEVVTINKAWTDMTGYEPDEIAQDLGFARGKALTDDALRESKGRMDALVNSLPGMAYRCYNEPGWSMEFCSDAAAEITGYEATELMLGGEVLYGDLIHPDDRERVWNCVQEAVQEDRKFELEYRIIGRDGNERWVWEQGCAVSPAGEEPVFLEGIITDITERKQVTAEKERLLQAVEMAQEAVIMTDAEGRIKYANAAAAEMQGYKRNDMIGLHVSEFNASEEPHGVTSEIMGTVRQEGSWEGEIRNERPDGTEIVTYASVSAVRDSDGRIVNYISTKNEITERKRAEHKMRIQSRAIESSINGITMIDAQGKVILANPATLKMWGYEDRDEVIGHMASEFWENPENARAAHRQTRQNAEWSGELVAERKDGSTFPVQVSMSLVRDEDTDSVYVIGVFLDLTERKKAEEQVQELASFQETVINGANVWIEVLDMHGDVILWNDAAEDITGYSREEVQGKGKIWEWLYPDPDYRAEIVERAQEVAQDEMDVV
ncbi:MAG: PAS domain S-box protein, partial [Planctomycetes bacterium]|nr:PAS domain S-box protein [Planctomycetota bacterium]